MMLGTSERPVSLIEATRTLFRTRTPSEAQIERVFRLMKSGALAAHDGGANRLRWTTTEAALAECLAKNQIRHTRTIAQDYASTTGDQEFPAAIERVYCNLWREYFLAVMFRRRVRRRAVAFRRAVLAGQVLLLLMMIATLVGTARQLAFFTSPPAEHVAIERWIEEQTDDFSITRWYPSRPSGDGQGVIVDVDYRYRKESPRWIHTNRSFVVEQESVAERSLHD